HLVAALQALHLFDELADVFELPVDRRESHVGDRIEPLQVLHDDPSELLAAYLFLGPLVELSLDVHDDVVDGLDSYRSLLARVEDRAAELLSIERLAPPVALDHVGQDVLDVLVGRVAPVALEALAAAPDELALAPYPRVDDPVLRVAAERAFHRAVPPLTPARAIVPVPASVGSVLIERETVRQLLNLAPHRRLDRGRSEIRQYAVDETRDLLHLRLAHAARGHRRRADADSAGHHGTLRLERHRVLVHGDPRPIERLLGVLAGDAAAGEVHQHEMRIGAASDEAVAALHQRRRERRGVLHDLLLVLAPRGRGGLVKRDRLAGDDVHQRPALHAGHDGLVERLRVLGPAQDHPAARPTKRLVRRGRNEVGDADGRGMQARRDEPGRVRDVGHECRADLARDLAERREVDGARERGAAGDDHLRPVLAGQVADLIQVDPLGVLAHAVRDDRVELAGVVYRASSSEMPALGKVGPRDGVAG